MQRTSTDLNKTVWMHPNQIDKTRKWWIVDAQGKTLGRLAVDIAKKLSGKEKAHNCDFWDCGDYVVVINADKIVVSGNKLAQKTYYHHTGWKGHLKQITLAKLMEKKPLKAVWFAVKGMLPKNKLRKPRLKRLKLFAGTEHNYQQMDLQTWDNA